MNLKTKLKILAIIYLKKWGFLHLVQVAKRIPLNEYSRELLEESDTYEVGGLFGDAIRYKKAIDPSGEYRFYLPDYDKSAVYRIDEKYSRYEEDELSNELLVIALKEGRKDKSYS